MSTENLCISCRRPKAAFTCDLCDEPVCKDCQELLEEGTFAFLKKIPEELLHTRYCQPCHDTHVAPVREKYDEDLQKAREAYFFFKTQKAPLPVLKRAQDEVRIESCPDRDETILRLAFMAITAGHNAILDAEITSEKVRNEGYQTSKWKGVGVPATIDVEKLEKRNPKQ